MTAVALLTHLLFFIAMLIVAVGCTWVMLAYVRIMAPPNERSSHKTLVPKSGGISMVATFLMGLLAIYVLGDSTQIDRGYFLGFVLSAIAIAVISFYDDITEKGSVFKFLTQTIAAVLVIAFGLVIDILGIPTIGHVELGWLGYLISFLWIVGLTNAFNFMDGLDGLAAGTAVIASVSFGVITFSQGSVFSYMACYAIAAGALGFLVFNFPPAKIFMGDVGSAFLGFLFATLAIVAARYDHSHTSFFVMPLLLFNFIYDTSFTFFRRLIRDDNVFQAHRDHLYQLFNRLGYSHRTVTLFHYGVCVAQGLAAWWMVRSEDEVRTIAFAPFAVFQVLYTIVVMRKAKRRALTG